MEHLQGQTLEARIQEKGALNISEALDYAIQISDALEVAHRAGVIHRDLKPANIFLVGPERRVKILDFGIAKLLRGESESCANEDVIMGTPAYMAPEQIRPIGEIDGRVDLYALGVILFEMFSGRRPFEGRRSVEVLMKHLDAPAPSLRSLIGGISDELEKVITRCLQKDPRERYSKVSALCRILTHLRQKRNTVRAFSTSPSGQLVFA
jgi:serine/threonine protein kinase